MKKNVLSGIALFTSLCFTTLITQAQNTIVSGHLKGLSDGIIKIFYNKDGVSTTDTVVATGDDFTWKINLDEPIRIALTASADNYYFFAQPGHIRLTGFKDSIQTYILSGSPMQKDADMYNAFIKDLTDQRDLLNAEFRNATIEEKAGITKKRDDLKKQWRSRTAQFIASHPKGFFSLYLITLEHDYYDIKRLYNLLDEPAKNTGEGIKIARQLKKLEKSQIGVQMVNFTQADTSGNPVNFNNFKGKYVLVDFWASWCMPCRAENPNVLSAYNSYKNKGFTVIGISLDDKAANWKKAIREDQLPWTQLSDLKGWKNDVSLIFGIQAIPSNLLIDPSGKIIAKDLRGTMLEDKLKALLN